MAELKQQRREPAGFTPRTAGLASEYAREQGWDISEEQRSQTPREKQKYDGGRDSGYGAQDFGDEPVDSNTVKSAKTPTKMGLTGYYNSQTKRDLNGFGSTRPGAR